MSKRGNVKSSEVIEGELLPATPPRVRLRLATVRDCRRELAKVYIEPAADNCQQQKPPDLVGFCKPWSESFATLSWRNGLPS